MAGQVLALFADNLAQPLFDLRVVDVIVINPALVAGVVGRIDIDALDTPLIPGQQRFQGFQIIAPNDHVFAAVVFVVLSVFIKAVLALQHPKRHVLMVIDHLAFPIHSSVGMGILLIAAKSFIYGFSARKNCFWLFVKHVK